MTVGLPVALLLGLLLDVGPIGVWLGLLIGLAVTAVLLLTLNAYAFARTAGSPPGISA